jgi:hypothetical protein
MAKEIQHNQSRDCVSPREAAQMMDIRLDALYCLLWANRLPAQKRDGRWHILRSAVEARMEIRRKSKEQANE